MLYFLLFFLYVLTSQNSDCCTIKINHGDNKTTIIKISVAVLSSCPEVVELLEDESDEVDIEVPQPVLGEVLFDGPVRASGKVKIGRHFGCNLLGQTPLTRLLNARPYMKKVDQQTSREEKLKSGEIIEEISQEYGEDTLDDEYLDSEEVSSDEIETSVGDIVFSGRVPASGHVRIIGSPCSK